MSMLFEWNSIDLKKFDWPYAMWSIQMDASTWTDQVGFAWMTQKRSHCLRDVHSAVHINIRVFDCAFLYSPPHCCRSVVYCFNIWTKKTSHGNENDFFIMKCLTLILCPKRSNTINRRINICLVIYSSFLVWPLSDFPNVDEFHPMWRFFVCLSTE